MQGDLRTEPAGDAPEPGARTFSADENIWARSYTYLRTAIVGLLVALGVSVLYETGRQGWHPLSSVSAYYYTPAQAIFVGALIGAGACMIALKGTTPVEEVALDLAGMFAALVAVIPTSRGQDYEAAVRACRQTGNQPLTGTTSAPDCPSVQALADATRANVENNVATLLVVGVLALVATYLFARRFQGRTGLEPHFWWGFGIAVAVVVVVAVARFFALDTLIGRGHYVAAVGLLGGILVVAVANAVRHDDSRPPASGMSAARVLLGDPRRLDRYALLAWSIAVAGGVGVILAVTGVVTLFVVELVVAALFATFWTVQTFERMPAPE